MNEKFRVKADAYVYRVAYFDEAVASEKGYQETTLNDGRQFKYTEISRQDIDGNTVSGKVPSGQIVASFRQDEAWVQEFKRITPSDGAQNVPAMRRSLT